MAHNEVLLIKPVENLGAEGDQVKVRAGYARNYLLPRGIAVPLTSSNRKQIEALKKRRAGREADELSAAQEMAGKLGKTRIAFAVKTGEGGKMFGAVTANDEFPDPDSAGSSTFGCGISRAGKYAGWIGRPPPSPLGRN